MKTKLFYTLMTVICVTLAANAGAATYVRIGVGVGGGYGCYPYRPYWGGYYPYGPAYFGPTVIYSVPVYSTSSLTYKPISTTTTKTTTTTVTNPSAANNQPTTTTEPPYGVPQDGNLVKSPFSSFQINDTGMKTGTVVYDTFTGQPFRIP